jgi:hypothetical protein
MPPGVRNRNDLIGDVAIGKPVLGIGLRMNEDLLSPGIIDVSNGRSLAHEQAIKYAGVGDGEIESFLSFRRSDHSGDQVDIAFGEIFANRLPSIQPDIHIHLQPAGDGLEKINVEAVRLAALVDEFVRGKVRSPRAISGTAGMSAARTEPAVARQAYQQQSGAETAASSNRIPILMVYF